MGDKNRKAPLPEELHDLANARAIYNKLLKDDIVPFKSGVDASAVLRQEIDRMSKDGKMNEAYRVYRESHGYIDKEYKRIDLSALAGGNVSASEVNQAFKDIRKKFPAEDLSSRESPEQLLKNKSHNPVKAADNIISETTFSTIETLTPEALEIVIAACDVTNFNTGKYCEAARTVYNRAQQNPNPRLKSRSK